MSTPASRHPSAPASPEEGPLAESAGAVLSFRTTAGWGNVPGNWAVSVSTQAATFEAWMSRVHGDDLAAGHGQVHVLEHHEAAVTHPHAAHRHRRPSHTLTVSPILGSLPRDLGTRPGR